MSLTPGTRIGPYEVLSMVGAGGMGEVYRARDTRLGRLVAIKFTRSDTADASQARALFEREGRAIPALSHPRICSVHDVGCFASQNYLVMESQNTPLVGPNRVRIPRTNHRQVA